jgi:hypothetical protein
MSQSTKLFVLLFLLFVIFTTLNGNLKHYLAIVFK